ncbi:hypothetical protein ACR6C2_27830 [Streptomyces sp. INA 01156]
MVPGTGVINLTTDNASRHASVRDDAVTDVDVRSVARFDKVPTGEACSYALSFGYQDTRNNYRARLSFVTSGAVQLRVEKEVKDVVTQLTSALTLATGVPAGTDWTIRVRREGSRIRVKAWASASAEPSKWLVDVTDSDFGAGRVGLRALANQGCTSLPMKLLVSRFQVTEATWAEPRPSRTGTGCGCCPSPSTGTGRRNWRAPSAPGPVPPLRTSWPTRPCSCPAPPR